VREANKGIALASLALGNNAEALRIAQLSMEIAVASANPADQARARWLLGRVSEAGGNTTAAVSHYSAAHDYAREYSNESLLVTAATSLAQVELQRSNIDAAGELIEEIRESAAGQREFMRLDARLAMARSDHGKALAIMSKLRTTAGEAWQPSDEALIRELEETGR